MNGPTYWINATRKGNGSSEENPAGNITFVLNEYDLTNATIKVGDGVYNGVRETFPLVLNSENVTFTSVNGSSVTTINGTGKDIFQVKQDGVTIQGFTLQYGSNGILLEESNYHNISENSITDCKSGIRMRNSAENRVSGNVMENCGLFLEGGTTKVSQQTIFTNNTVNGDPIRYYSNQSDVEVPSNTGQVIFADTHNSTISGLNLSDTTIGIQLLYSHNVTISNSTFADNMYGVWVWGSPDNTIIDTLITHNLEHGISLLGTGNTITGNTITNNTRNGIHLFPHEGDAARNNVIWNNSITSNYNGLYLTSDDVRENLISSNNVSLNRDDGINFFAAEENKIAGNTLMENQDDGIEFYLAEDNLIMGNNITENQDDGIDLLSSEENKLYKNNIFANNVNAKDNTGDNSFNGSTIGNYWGDIGNDEDEDGIIDTPYQIAGNESKDYLPSVKMFSSQVLRPSVSLSLAKETLIVSGIVTINIVVKDVDLKNATLSIGDEDHTWEHPGTYTYMWNSTSIGSGDRTITLRAYDRLGKRSETSITVTVDNIRPSVRITSPSNDTNVETSQVFVKWNGSDEESGISYYNVSKDENSEENVGLNESKTFTFQSGGIHEVTVKAVDVAGNTRKTAVTIKVPEEDEGGLGTTMLVGVGIGIIVAIAIIWYVRRRR